MILLRTGVASLAPGTTAAVVHAKAVFGLLALALVCLLYPVASNAVPPLLDYGGHLSRIFVLYNLIHGIGFGDMYRLHFAVVPNLAIDGIVLGLMELGLPIEIAGRCFLALSLILLAGGVVLLHYATFRRASLWPILALAFLYQDIFFWGLMNYMFGVGLALCGAALWRLMSRRNLRVAAVILLLTAVALFFSHLLSLLLMLGLVIVFELGGLLGLGIERERPGLLYLAVSAIAGGLPILLLLFSPLVADNDPPTFTALIQQLDPSAIRARLSALRGVFHGYDDWIDRASFGCFLALIGYGLLARRMRFDTRILAAGAGLLAVYLIVPDGWFHTAALPDRLPMVVFLLAMAGTDLVPVLPWEGMALPVLVAALLLARGAAVQAAWQDADTAFQPLLAAFRTIPEGSRIYSAIAYKGDFGSITRRPYYELPGYAAIYSHAFYPHTFALESQNIVVRQPEYEAAPSMPRNYRVDRPRQTDDPYDTALLGFYDYALVVNPAYWPQKPPPRLTPVSSGPDYTLFRIQHGG